MSNEWIELYRAFVPRGRIMNDNSGQHYRTMQGKLDFLKAQFEAFENNDPGYRSIIGDLKIDDIIETRKLLTSTSVNIRCEVWRANNVRFDPHNYAKTFKMPIDKLTDIGLIAEDDNWKFVASTVFSGGGALAWPIRSYISRNVNYTDDPIFVEEDGCEIMADGLPRDMDIRWWNKYSKDLGEIFIRILISEEI